MGKTKLRADLKVIILTFILGASIILHSGPILGADDFATPERLEYVNVDLGDILRDLAGIGKFKILFAHEFSKKATMVIEAGSFLKQTVGEIATNHGLKEKWLNSNTVVIGDERSLAQIETGDVNLHVLPLQYTPSLSVAKALETVVSSYKIRYDFKTNEIAVMANSLELQNIKALINEGDRDLPLINMEVKVVEVTADFLQAVGLSSSASSQLKVYPLTQKQMAIISEHTGGTLLARQEVISFNKQQEALLFGDQIPDLAEEKLAGSVNYQIGYIDLGTNIDYSTRIQQEAEAELVVQLQAKVTTVEKQEDGPVGTKQRQLKTTVGLKPGETLLLTGALSRDEFSAMKSSRYELSFLSSLFNRENDAGAKAVATMILMAPSFTEKIAYQTPQVVPGITVNKSIEPILREQPKAIGEINTTNIPYIIKKHDTVIGLSRKFGIRMESIIKVNQLQNPSIIKTNTVLLIPIPNERIYVLKHQETIWRLAKRYGTTVAVLKDLNGIKDVTKLCTGQKIILPVPVTRIANSKY